MSPAACNTPAAPEPPCNTRRQYVAVRLSPGGVTRIDAAAAGVTRSAMIRAGSNASVTRWR